MDLIIWTLVGIDTLGKNVLLQKKIGSWRNRDGGGREGHPKQVKGPRGLAHSISQLPDLDPCCRTQPDQKKEPVYTRNHSLHFFQWCPLLQLWFLQYPIIPIPIPSLLLFLHLSLVHTPSSVPLVFLGCSTHLWLTHPFQLQTILYCLLFLTPLRLSHRTFSSILPPKTS